MADVWSLSSHHFHLAFVSFEKNCGMVAKPGQCNFPASIILTF